MNGSAGGVADADPRLARLRPAEPEFRLPLWLLTRANVPLGAGAEAFKTFLVRGGAKRIGREAGAPRAARKP